jgi:catechol 2,3-dioxygenase-like lactoylglutathione lyase family enzyme
MTRSLRDHGGCVVSAYDDRVFASPQINFHVRDVEASAGFYRDLLGFKETFRTPRQGRPDHVELRLDGFVLGVASADALRDVHGVTASTDGVPRAELVLWTDDVDKEIARLEALGVRVLSAPHDFLDSLRSAWIADLDDNPIQVVMRR